MLMGITIEIVKQRTHRGITIVSHLAFLEAQQRSSCILIAIGYTTEAATLESTRISWQQSSLVLRKHHRGVKVFIGPRLCYDVCKVRLFEETFKDETPMRTNESVPRAFLQ